MKKLIIAALLLCLLMTLVACNQGTTPETPATEAPTTEAPTTEVPTTEEPTTEEPTTEEVTTEAPTETESETEPASEVTPTAIFTAQDLSALTATNADATLVDGYVHYLTGTADSSTNPSINLSAGEGEFSDIIAIKYRTNCGHYGSNYWGTFLINGTEEFQGNRANSDNWFYYFTDGTWDVLILDLRRNMAGSAGTPDTDVVDGAAITSMIYNFFDYEGNGGKLTTEDGEAEYIDIEYIAFFNTQEEAQDYCY